MRVLIGTSNPGKKREFLYLAPPSWEVIFPEALGIDTKPPETGADFSENALQKLNFYRRLFDGNILGEDSGLVVPVLGNRPGILSSRYASSEAEARKKLLAELANVPWEQRGAYYYCAIAMYYNGKVYQAEGRVDGFINTEECGDFGFGYDPIFYWPPAGTTFGQIPPEIKNEVSHRARAFRALLDLLP